MRSLSDSIARGVLSSVTKGDKRGQAIFLFSCFRYPDIPLCHSVKEFPKEPEEL
jgi:hypothetical protein